MTSPASSAVSPEAHEVTIADASVTGPRTGRVTARHGAGLSFVSYTHRGSTARALRCW